MVWIATGRYCSAASNLDLKIFPFSLSLDAILGVEYNNGYSAYQIQRNEKGRWDVGHKVEGLTA
jgi:hypothetical protein